MTSAPRRPRRITAGPPAFALLVSATARPVHRVVRAGGPPLAIGDRGLVTTRPR
jgi:hypothetical protein